MTSDASSPQRLLPDLGFAPSFEYPASQSLCPCGILKYREVTGSGFWDTVGETQAIEHTNLSLSGKSGWLCGETGECWITWHIYILKDIKKVRENKEERKRLVLRT